jgi:hypothetical protein
VAAGHVFFFAGLILLTRAVAPAIFFAGFGGALLTRDPRVRTIGFPVAAALLLVAAAMMSLIHARAALPLALLVLAPPALALLGPYHRGRTTLAGVLSVVAILLIVLSFLLVTRDGG